jgi:flagella basal body P-ring formation protein FlgA
MRSKSRKPDIFLGATLLLSTLGVAANTESSQSHASIRAAAEQHAIDQAEEMLQGRPVVKVGRLDSRLKLAECDRQLTAFDSPNGLSGGRGVVGVRCEGSTPWKIYVPVNVALMAEVVVTKTPVVRGQSLAAEDLVLREMDVASERKAVFKRIEDAVGLRSKRTLQAGSLLHAGLLKRAKLIRRGNQVEILATIDGLQVRMRGKAMADGGRGDRIQVKNMRSGRLVTGTVTGHGVIEVLN